MCVAVVRKWRLLASAVVVLFGGVAWGEEPWEWKCRSEENRLLVSSCRALGHGKALFVSCPYADHGRAYTAGIPYVEMFIKGRLPMAAKNNGLYD